MPILAADNSVGRVAADHPHDGKFADANLPRLNPCSSVKGSKAPAPDVP